MVNKLNGSTVQYDKMEKKHVDYHSSPLSLHYGIEKIISGLRKSKIQQHNKINQLNNPYQPNHTCSQH